MEERPPVWRVTANILNKQSRTENKGWSSILGLREVVTTNHPNNWPCRETEACALGLTDLWVRRKQREMDMRFCTSNVMSLYRSGSLNKSSQGISKIYIRFCGCTGSQVEHRGHCKSRG